MTSTSPTRAARQPPASAAATRAKTRTPTRATAARSSRTSQRDSERGRSGRAAEQLVAEYLLSQGYQIVATNLRLQYLELDVVARRGDVVVVVEVRSRSSAAWTSGFGSLDGKKRHRIKLAGHRLWQRRYARDLSVNRIRFDAASVTFGPNGPVIEYAEAAF